MEKWYRVFGATDVAPPLPDLECILVESGVSASLQSDGNPEGWFRTELTIPPLGEIVLERWLADEEGVRAELNNWAAFLETCEDNPQHQALMEKTIQSRQIITIAQPAHCPD